MTPTHLPESSEVQLEHAFLRERVLSPDSSWVGMSSNAMLAQALTGAAEAERWPFDKADLARCEETYRRAPAHLQALMLPTLERFRRHIAEGGLYCRRCDNSFETCSTVRGLCRKCRGIDQRKDTA